ncbi:MFS-type transporter SLC18B1-like [Watersipora subatra]|uniref:MFS-type transporter SLC18B1-like n=1 Tax=Watersipora subatra TaxID=2589382 RepID=UPI00355B7677
MCLFGCISFIPHNASVYYLLAGFTLRGLLGVGASAVFVSAQTYITYTFPQSSVFMLSLLGAVGGLGSISGPAIGGGLYALSGFWLIFVTVGLATLSFGILMVFLLPSYDSKKSMQPRDHKCMDVSEAVSSPAQLQRSHLYARIICDRRMILGLLVTMFSAAAWHAFDPILEPELRKTYDLPKSKTSLIFLLIPTAFVIMTPIAGKIMDKLKYLDGLGMTALGFAILATAFLFAGPAPFIPIDKRLWLLLVCLTVSGLANSWIFVPPQEMTFNIKRLNLSSDEEKIAAKGFMSGCWNACYASGVCLGMVMSGSIQEVTNWSWAMMFYFVGSVGFIIIILLVKITELKSWQNLFN